MQIENIKNISKHMNEIKVQVQAMISERKIANKINDIEKKAENYNTKVKPYLDSIRYHIDKLELIVDNELWPMPKYRKLLFL